MLTKKKKRLMTLILKNARVMRYSHLRLEKIL